MAMKGIMRKRIMVFPTRPSARAGANQAFARVSWRGRSHGRTRGREPWSNGDFRQRLSFFDLAKKFVIRPCGHRMMPGSENSLPTFVPSRSWTGSKGGLAVLAPGEDGRPAYPRKATADSEVMG